MKYLIEKNSLVKYKYSQSSLDKLVDVHPSLVDFAFELANIVDCKLIYGVRTDAEQLQLYKDGKSSFDGITKKSNHQLKENQLGYALDILPLLDGLCQGLAYKLDIKIKTGFKWRDNMMDSLKRNESENTLPDGNHVELIKK